MPKVSVIVPVFNGEAHISECIESLLVQTLRDIEIILIDDGSTDDTGRICRRYAASDNRIVLIQQENAGVSAARNAGLCVAKGEYLAFADADDVVPKCGLDALCVGASESRADLVIGDYSVAVGDEVKLVRTVRSDSTRDWVSSILEGRNHSALWNKMIRREALGAARFPEGIRYAEDQVLLIKCYVSGSLDVAFVNSSVYTHRLSTGSATRSGGPVLFDLLRAKTEIGMMIADAGLAHIHGRFIRYGAERAVVSVVRNIGISHSESARVRLRNFAESMKNLGFPLTGATRARVLLELARLPNVFWTPALSAIRFIGGRRFE